RAVLPGVVGTVMLLAAGCTGQTSTPQPSPRTTATTDTVVTAACQRTLNFSPNGFPEFMGQSNSPATLYGLLFASYPLMAGREAKIAWRMTGSGDVRFTATGPNGQQISPLAGPTPHADSNWHRPGDEWGTFFRFPTRG